MGCDPDVGRQDFMNGSRTASFKVELLAKTLLPDFKKLYSQISQTI